MIEALLWNRCITTVGTKILLQTLVCGKLVCVCMFPLYNYKLLAEVKGQ